MISSRNGRQFSYELSGTTPRDLWFLTTIYPKIAQLHARPGSRPRFSEPARPAGPGTYHPGMEMTLRFEIFPSDLDAIVDFYTRVLSFSVTKDQRHEPAAYVSMQRGAVQVGAASRAVPDVAAARAARLPPAGVELVLEVDDVAVERDRVAAAGWPLEQDLQDRPWGLTDFRIIDPAGYYLRITSRAG